MYSLIIPVYKNESNIKDLLIVLRKIHSVLDDTLEVVFVVDSSPDDSYNILKKLLIKEPYVSQLILLSKNFGSFMAIRTGIQKSRGDYFAVMAADLQEPFELIISFFKILIKGSYDILIGTREKREDPFFSKISSNIFWYLYKKFIIKDMPKGGIDIFACNKLFRSHLLELKESHSSLIAQIFWLGFRRKEIPYTRLERKKGVSSWTFSKKLNYMMDSIFSFTDLPIKILTKIGLIGTVVFGILGMIVFISKIMGIVTLEGYTSTFLSIGFFGTLNLYAISIVGMYTWRIYENTKNRPLSIILRSDFFDGRDA